MATDFIRVTATTSSSVAGGPCLLSQVFIPGTLGGSTADASDCLARFRAAWNAMAAQVSSGVTILFNPTVLGYSLLTGKVDSVWTATPAVTVTGTATGDQLPPQTQGLIRWNTNGIVNGHRVRGRWYIPYPVEAASGSAGSPSGTYQTGLAAGVTALLTAGSTPSTPAVYHRKSSSSSASVWGITGGAAGPTWAVQRGRRQ